jgi:hypothetical protein
MSSSLLLLIALLLSEPTSLGSPLALWGILLVLVAVATVSWRSGLHLVRRKQEKAMVFAGVVVLLVALASSLSAYQLFVGLVFG